MTIIANPIYDTVFKYLMEDNRVAKILLSALLQKEVVEVQMRQHEYTGMGRSKISLFRLDFSAKIREKDGGEHLILIELQKTWLATETLRFRQYLGTQYLEENNVAPKEENPQGYALPMISIYILGHKLGDLQEPVVYVRRRYLDQKSNVITQGVPDPFIESLTHDTIIVQIPYLKGRTRNRLERLLNVFDQNYRLKENGHFLEIDEDKLEGEEQLVVYRLAKATVARDVQRDMQVEDEILSEIERRDTDIMRKDAEIKEKEQVIEEKKQEIVQKEQEIVQKEQEIVQKEQEIVQKEQEIVQKEQEIVQNRQLLRSMVSLLQVQGLSINDIAKQLNITESEVDKILSGK